MYDYEIASYPLRYPACPTGEEGGRGLRRGNFIGAMFFGGKGYMVVEDSGFKTFFGDQRQPGEAMNMAESAQDEYMPHITNFLEAVRSGGGRTSSRKSKRLLCRPISFTWPTSVTVREGSLCSNPGALVLWGTMERIGS